MLSKMDGQWIGRADGDVPGTAVVEIDDFGPTLDLIAYLFPDDISLPGTAVRLKPRDRGPVFELLHAPLIPVDPAAGFWLTRPILAEQYPGVTLSEYGDVRLEVHGDGRLSFSFKTEITSGGGTLLKSRADQPSELVPSASIKSWDKFKETVWSVEPNRFFYRGQSDRRRLRTSFHRTCRKNLAIYRDVDVDELRRALSSRLKHVFDRREPSQTGAFYNLLQHHGYPTPLLDWTLSPFVAAYFAFNPKVDRREERDCVRIFTFDAKAWREDYLQSSATAYARPHFSIIELLAIENPRMVPQQATATITNIDDIETYLIARGVERGKQYITPIDLPISDRQQALSDLNLMGINAGALFPGLDGACEALRYKNFGA
jgi:FRG domain.